MKTNKEVNQILAEFMGGIVETVDSWSISGKYQRIIDHSGSYKPLYTESLDACVPVMEKLNMREFKVNIDLRYDDDEDWVQETFNDHFNKYKDEKWLSY